MLALGTNETVHELARKSSTLGADGRGSCILSVNFVSVAMRTHARTQTGN